VPERELPTGKGGELEQYASEHWRERLVQFAEVKNTVDWVNPDFPNLPFRIEEGKSTPLGMFAEMSFPTELHRRLKQDSEGRCLLEVSPEHRRSTLLGRVIFQDAQGNLYRDVDIKGIGSIEFPRFFSGSKNAHVTQPGGELDYTLGKRGLLDYNLALYDRDTSEAFLRAGISTSRTVGIIKLEELLVDEKRVGLEEVRNRGLLDPSFQPVLEMRAFGTKTRIQDLESHENPELLLNDARALVSQMVQQKGDIHLSYPDYFLWFAKTLGKNVAHMHENGWHHDFLTPHNITLDARIVDLDSVGDLTTERGRNGDWTAARGSLSMFASLVAEMRRAKFGELSTLMRETFERSYDEVFPQEARKRYFANTKREAAA